ncbi:hypothetical protein EI94DRAFT_1698069 [Lactarius quietus]|nr:hypothetical protein EI94DRAFT_1698069 [Lactarius quietus]
MDTSAIGFTHYSDAKQHRDGLAPLFSTASILQMQGLVQERCFTVDVIMAFCYVKNWDATKAPDFESDIVLAFHAVAPIITMAKYSGTFFMLRKVLMDQIDVILRDPGSLKNASHRTIYHLLDADADKGPLPSKLSLWHEAGALFAAGSDTIAVSTTTTSYHVLHNPEVQQRLVKELRSAWQVLEDVPRYEVLEKLPYLTAVVKEGLPCFQEALPTACCTPGWSDDSWDFSFLEEPLSGKLSYGYTVLPRINEYIEEHIKRHGRRLDYYERNTFSPSAVRCCTKAFGLKAKLLHAKRHAEKVQLKKTLKAHDERNVKQKDSSNVPDGALPTFLLDREGQKDAKALSTAIKQKRKDKAAKYAVPLPKVRGIAEDEMFKVMRTGKSKKKSWKRMVTKATFVGEGFTRKPVKMERFVRPMALRYKKANVTHQESPIPHVHALGVLTKGTVIEVNVSELGMVTAGGKVVFGKYAQVTNNPENDGCINAVLPPGAASEGTSTRHARNALEKQRQQLERLLRDPAKPAAVPAPPKEKTIRPPREMMKNVQGSSAGAGSGEFHVYKASRRLEYERLKAISDGARKEAVSREFEEKKRQRAEEAEAKTAKNRARRQKKKERAKGSKSVDQGGGGGEGSRPPAERGASHKEAQGGQWKGTRFRRPGEESDDEEGEEDGDNEDQTGPQPALVEDEQEPTSTLSVPVAKAPTIMIHEDD